MKRTMNKVVSMALIIAMLMATIFTEGVTVSADTNVTDNAGEIINKCTNAVIVSDTTSYSNLVSNSEIGTVVKLTADCTLSDGIIINLATSEAITLDLNGFIITGSISNDNQAVIYVSNGVLNIVDTSDSKLGSIYNAYNGSASGSGILLAGGTVNFYSGTILAPGQAFNLEGGTFNMYGGQLIGIETVASEQCEALTAIGGTFNIYAGYLSGASNDFWKGGTATGKLQGGYYSDESVLETATVDTLYTFGNLSSPVTISTIKGEYTLSKWVYLTSTSGISLKISATSHLADQLTAKFMEGSTEKFLTASYTWQRSSDGSSWSDITGATNKYYMVGSMDEGKKLRVVAKIGTNTLTSDPSTVYTQQLVNGSFEYPEINKPLGSSWSVYHTLTTEEQANFGWTKTVDLSQKLEFGGDWNVTPWGIQFIPEGRQFIELNADEQSAIYQDLSTTPGTVFYWSLYQGGVWYNDNTGGQNIDNTMAVRIGTPDQLNTRDTMISRTITTYDQPWTNRTIYELNSMTVVSSIPSAYDGKDLDKKKLYTEPKRWTKYEGIYVVPEGQTVTRFVFASLSENPLQGNLLDGVIFRSTGNHTAEASANTSTPTAGEDDAITLTVKNSSGNTNTSFNGPTNVTITGVEEAPNGTYGSFNGTALNSDSAGVGQVISVTFTDGVATANLKLNKADAQTIGFSIGTVTTPATNTLTITPTHGTASAMAVTQNITAPASNGGNFAQQPKITIKDAFGNICTSDNTTVVTAAKEDAGTWTLTGTTTATASSGAATFTNLGATNTSSVSNAQLGFTSGSMTKVTSAIVTLPATAPSIDGGSSGSSTPPPNQGAVIIIVNGKEQEAGKETKTTEDGKSTVIVQVNNKVIESKIDEAVKGNTRGTGNVIQVPVVDKKSEVTKIELTGDIVKKLEENTFEVSIKCDNVEYVIPAEEFTISKVAEKLGVSQKDLDELKVEVKITKLDEKVLEKYSEIAKENGAELIFPPVSFEVVAKTTKADGTTGNMKISQFSNYVERVMEMPAGIDLSKVTTGIVFNPDGTYSHVPTAVFQKDGKRYAKLSSLTNSEYSVIWNPITIKSVENHWSKDAVNDMASRLVIFNPETFDPNKAITRADFAEYIVRALGLYREGSKHENKFKDVSEAGDRTLAILIASEYGIVAGYTDSTFKPDALITREEAMAMYQRAMTVTKLVGTDNDRYQSYTDYKLVGSWATTYVKAVLSAHVFNGTTATTISPKSNLTYAEAAQAIKNLLVESKLINL